MAALVKRAKLDGCRLDGCRLDGLGMRRIARRWLGALRGTSASRERFWAALGRDKLALRGLGVVYVVAFTSLKAEVLGLYGERGVLPAREVLEAVDRALAEAPSPRSWLRRFQAAPSLLWLGASDARLRQLCTVGQLAGAGLALGIAERAAAFIAWGAYLSFVSVGRDFLRFQWDALLLEAGLQAALGRPRRLLTRLLAFRLQLESGLAKLASGDPTWRDLSACAYHQETQPLPTPAGWYAHHLPAPVQRAATALTLFAECALPLLILGPLRLRRVAFALLTGFQGLIALTGNYAFFNWLTTVLNLTLVERPRPRASPAQERAPSRALRMLEAAAALPVLMLGLADLARRLLPRAPPFAPAERISRALAPFQVASSYGLFSTMTTARPEIVIEGSEDGQTWCPYDLPYKPGDVGRAPRWVAPHQPRLDWQLWFAALGYPPPWFARLLRRLLEGSPEVLTLFEHNPFPDRPPRYLRAILYLYRMTDLRTHRRTGAWWTRREIGVYFPACGLAGNRANVSGQFFARTLRD